MSGWELGAGKNLKINKFLKKGEKHIIVTKLYVYILLQKIKKEKVLPLHRYEINCCNWIYLLPPPHEYLMVAPSGMQIV